MQPETAANIVDAPLPTPSDLAWVSNLAIGLTSKRQPTELARLALEAVLSRTRRIDGMVAAINGGGILNELVPARTVVLAGSGEFANLSSSETLPDKLRTALELALNDSERNTDEHGVRAYQVPTGERIAFVMDGPFDIRCAEECDVAAGLLVAHLAMRVLQRTHNTDPLTGLPTMAAGLHVLRKILMFAARTQTVTSIVRFQIDGMQNLRESYGTAAADLVIRAVARATRTTCRHTDELAPAGSGGFLLILPATPLTGGLRVGESLREYLSAIRVDFEKQELQLTVSCGVAVAELGTSDARHLIRRAEQAMQHMVEVGGNRVGTAALYVTQERRG
ncbi:MAG: diguanylate cyclase (GGDEF)-like protein [Myxococcota bacterium]|jgi:diguanylate cyclase (GGDEF)-like protein